MAHPVNTAFVDLAPDECLDRATAFMVRRGYTLTSRRQHSVTFARPGGPDVGIGCALMFLFIIPGIIYLLLSRGKPVHTTIIAVPENGRTRLSFNSEERPDEWAVIEFLGSLAVRS